MHIINAYNNLITTNFSKTTTTSISTSLSYNSDDFLSNSTTNNINTDVGMTIVNNSNSGGSNAVANSISNNTVNSNNPYMTTTTVAASTIYSPAYNYNLTTSTNSSNININYDDSNEVLHTIETIGSILNCYYVPILVCTGSIGNILSVFVFFKTKLRKLSSSFYLAALAVSDTCFLFGLFVQWLNFVDVHLYNRDFFCQFFTFFSSLACFCSAWFVVAFTVERFIAVAYPLKRQTMCTVRRAKIVLFGLTTVGCVHCIPFWISSTPIYSPKLEVTICDMKSEYKVLEGLSIFQNTFYYLGYCILCFYFTVIRISICQFKGEQRILESADGESAEAYEKLQNEIMTLINYWDTIVVFAIPFTTIVILNTFTGCTVWKFATVRRTLTMQKRKTQLTHDALTSSSTYRITSLKRQKSTYSHSSCGGQNAVPQENFEITRKSGRRKITNSSQLKVTKMLLIVSTVFVCLNLPSCVMRIKTYLETQTSANEKATVVLQYIFQLLFITNFGINFVLYCVSGQNFRKAVLSIFRRVSSSTHREGTTQVTVSEYCRNSGGGGGTGASTRRRLMTQHCWNEIHELHSLK